jgi:hypothetical protein
MKFDLWDLGEQICKIGLVVCFIGLFFCVYLLFRNQLVYNNRTNLAEKVNIMNTIEINEGKNYDGWRYHALGLYSYDRMMWELLKFNWTWEEVKDNYNKEIITIKEEMK